MGPDAPAINDRRRLKQQRGKSDRKAAPGLAPHSQIFGKFWVFFQNLGNFFQNLGIPGIYTEKNPQQFKYKQAEQQEKKFPCMHVPYGNPLEWQFPQKHGLVHLLILPLPVVLGCTNARPLVDIDVLGHHPDQAFLGAMIFQPMLQNMLQTILACLLSAMLLWMSQQLLQTRDGQRQGLRRHPCPANPKEPRPRCLARAACKQ